MKHPNPYQNYATRQIVLSSGIRTKVLDFDRNTGDTWQAWIFSNDPNDKSTNVEFQLRGSFGTNGTIETTTHSTVAAHSMKNYLQGISRESRDHPLKFDVPLSLSECVV